MAFTALVTLTVRLWTGWTREQPKPVVRQFQVCAGDNLTPRIIGIEADTFVIRIDSVLSNEVLVTYSGLVITNLNGTVNLRAPSSGRAVFRKHTAMKFSTPTMDAGTSVELAVGEIESSSSPAPTKPPSS